MCELFAMSFNQPVEATFSLRGFRRRGRQNPDGWGLAWYPDKSVQVIKEPLEAGESQLSAFFLRYGEVKSRIYMAHVRLSSSGAVGYRNTHPFWRELDGRAYSFAHNGTLSNYRVNLPVGRCRPIGETDSEHAFCHILECIGSRESAGWDEEECQWFWAKLREVNQCGSFNCLLSDGEHLFCYHDGNGYNRLCFATRAAPYSSVRLLDEDFEVHLREEKNPSQSGFVIATRPITNERWEDFQQGELIVLKSGRMIFSSSERIDNSTSVFLSEIEIGVLQLLRKSPHRVSLQYILMDLDLSRDETKYALCSLLKKHFIRQDSRDRVGWDSDGATFYTEPSKREEIDNLLGRWR